MSEPYNSDRGAARPQPDWQQGAGQPSQGQPPGPWQQGYPAQPQQPLTHAQALAQARAAQAHAKALRPWYKKKRYLIPLALLLFVVTIGINGRDDDGTQVATPAAPQTAQAPASEAANPTEQPPPSTTNPTTAKKPEPVAARIGDKVAAGEWDFTVTNFKCGINRVGDKYLNKKPQGQFCFMNIKVKNNGNEAATLDGGNQKVLDSKGREFSSDGEAAIYEDSDSRLFLEEINPGNTATGLIVFDIPKDTEPVQALLAGGLFGRKDVATVDLR